MRLTMTLYSPNTGSIAGKFVDVHGVGRGISQNPTFRNIKSDKAALGKCRRLMSSCIKVPCKDLNSYPTYHTLFNLTVDYSCSPLTIRPVQNTSLDFQFNAGEYSSQSLLPQVDRMSRSRQIPNAEAGKRAYSAHRSVPSEEELRLLGRSVYAWLLLFQGLANH